MTTKRIVFTGSDDVGVAESFTPGKEYVATECSDTFIDGWYDVIDNFGETWAMNDSLCDFRVVGE